MLDEVRVFDRRTKIALLVVSSATIVAIAVAALQENYFADWYGYRRGYADLLNAKADDEAGRTAAAQFSLGIVQNFVPSLDAVDRCTTCHAGVDDPRMVDVDQPFRTHPGRHLEFHDPEKFGCTVCHLGQGRAATKDDAHGRVAHWDWPMLEHRYVQSSCTKCHQQSELLVPGGLIDRANAGSEDRPVKSLLAEGVSLATKRGCNGCHVVDGKGGMLGPDLTLEAVKTRHDFDFSHVGYETPRDVAGWLERHFVEPAVVSPGSVMPAAKDQREAEALTAYMLSRNPPLGSEVIYRSDNDGNGAALGGEEIYLSYCSACHGEQGRGSQVASITTPALNNPDFLAVAGDEYLRKIIASGRGGTSMPAWRKGEGNLSRDEIDRVVAHLRGWEQEGALEADVGARFGDAELGSSYYRSMCAGCHGAEGEGGIGNALRSQTFLAVADDRMLARSIIAGRPGTAMPSWRHLSAQTISDILAFIRKWQPEPASYEAVVAGMARVDQTINAAFGKAVYTSHCLGCHGSDGEGLIGPSIVSEDFLAVVDDRYLYRAIVEGRPSTAMPAWRHLSGDDLGALITYLRSFQRGPARLVSEDVVRGNYNVGRVLYEESCAACHGVQATGSIGPQLANSVFLDSATDGMLAHWISHGRTGTAMKGFGQAAQGLVTLDERQIADIIAYIRLVGERSDVEPQRLGIGRALVGREIYADSCASCHGGNGEGASGPQLANPYFLDSVSDGYLEATIVLGRSGTAMQPMVHGFEGLGQIQPEQVQDLVAFMRTWGSPRTWRLTRQVSDLSESAVTAGRDAYGVYCAGCHGQQGLGSGEGDGSFAPALNNADFLAAASDGFLLATIVRGRMGTPMRPFGRGSGGIVGLDAETISNIVSFIRSWQAESAVVMTTGSYHEEN